MNLILNLPYSRKIFKIGATISLTRTKKRFNIVKTKTFIDYLEFKI